MRGSGERERRLTDGPEIVSLAVLVLVAALVAAALGYAWVATRGSVDGGAARGGSAPCATMASCDGGPRISPRSLAPAM